MNKQRRDNLLTLSIKPFRKFFAIRNVHFFTLIYSLSADKCSTFKCFSKTGIIKARFLYPVINVSGLNKNITYRL